MHTYSTCLCILHALALSVVTILGMHTLAYAAFSSGSQLSQHGIKELVFVKITSDIKIKVSSIHNMINMTLYSKIK